MGVQPSLLHGGLLVLRGRPAHFGSSQSLPVLPTFPEPPARGPGRHEGEAGRPLRETDPGQPVHGKQTAALM